LKHYFPDIFDAEQYDEFKVKTGFQVKTDFKSLTKIVLH